MTRPEPSLRTLLFRTQCPALTLAVSVPLLAWSGAGWLAVTLPFAVLIGGVLWIRGQHRRLEQRLRMIAFVVERIAASRPGPTLEQRSHDAIGAIEAELALLQFTVQAREDLLREESERRAFDARLHRAFEMAADEEAVWQVVERAFERVDPSLRADVLLAESNEAPLARVVASEAGRGVAPCSVVTVAECPAARGGRTRVFADNGHLDACPRLQGKAGRRCSAVCVPLSIGGHAMGVIHTRSDAGDPPDEATISRLESVAAETGIRLGMIRALESSERAAATDPLTGLLNRRSMEARARRFAAESRPYSVVIADIDHFKRLNDNHGHATGDRALVAFAACLRDAVRADDVVCRYGGEEFVLLLPGCDPAQAVAILDRVRRVLPERTRVSNVPAFTASFGVAGNDGSSTLAGALERADRSLYDAKGAGRDCIRLAGAA